MDANTAPGAGRLGVAAAGPVGTVGLNRGKVTRILRSVSFPSSGFKQILTRASSRGK